MIIYRRIVSMIVFDILVLIISGLGGFGGYFDEE